MPALWKLACAGTAARSCGCAAVRAGSAAVSVSAGWPGLRRGCRGRAVRPGAPARVLPRHLPGQHREPGTGRRAPSPARAGSTASGSGAVPPQQRGRRHQLASLRGSWQQPGQGGKDRPVGPVQPRRRVLAPQHRDLPRGAHHSGQTRRSAAYIPFWNPTGPLDPDVLLGDGAVAPLRQSHHPAAILEFADHAGPVS
jgi:hypothetical protein